MYFTYFNRKIINTNAFISDDTAWSLSQTSKQTLYCQ